MNTTAPGNTTPPADSTPPTKTTRRSRIAIIGGSIGGAAVIAAAVTGLLLAFDSPAGTNNAAGPTPAPSHHAVTPVNPPHHDVIPPAQPNTPAHPDRPALLAAQVATLQRQLASLNYYEGPINGVMTPETVQSIKYLQRDAQLPQNGDYDQLTYLALQRFLTGGNNQMAG